MTEEFGHQVFLNWGQIVSKHMRTSAVAYRRHAIDTGMTTRDILCL